MRAVVPAAGRGSRLVAAGEHVPKPLVDVAGRPAILRVLDMLADGGISDAVIVTGHRAAAVEQRLEADTPVPVQFVRQPRPSGTADAILRARSFLDDGAFVFVWSDVLMPSAAIRETCEAADAAGGALGVTRFGDSSAGAAVVVDDDGWVRRFVEKPIAGSVPTGWSHAGVGVLGPAIWSHLEAVTRSPRGEYELSDAIDGLLDAGGHVRAVPVAGYWFDIGTPQRLEAARAYFATG